MVARKIQYKFKGGVLLLILLSTVVSAEGDNKKASSVIPNKEVQADEVVHVIKLEDILKGKYSHEKAAAKEETTNQQEQEHVADAPAHEEIAKAVEKPAVNNDSSLDISEAYNALMGYPTDTANQAVKKAPVKANPKVEKAAPRVTPAANGKSTGWLYLGKFSQGQWDQPNHQVLGLKGVLPKVGQRYSVAVYSNVRQGYPSKKGMPPIVKVLPQGSKVNLLALHNSGHSGHYWAQVQWF